MSSNNIFVSIASFRDNEAIDTILNLYMNAKNPNSIFIGICQQNNINIDLDIIHNLHFNIYNNYKNNIRIIRIPYYDASGPYFARYLCASLIDFNNEDFFLQIDSHTTFIENWDQILIDMYYEIINTGLSNKPIISYHPKNKIYINNEDDNNYLKVPVFSGVKFIKEKGVFILDASIYTNTNTYIKTPYSAAGMIFSSSLLLKEVPFNLKLTHLFDGEEIYNSIRFYLNDYDIFIPKINIIFHEYTRKDKPKFWDEPLCKFNDTSATNYINKFIFNLNIKGKNNRTIKDFYKFANINIYQYYFEFYLYKYIIFIFLFIIIIVFLFFF